MKVYYNEFASYPVEWLENQIKNNQIAGGRVDDRSIKLVSGNELEEYKRCHFFAGPGSWEVALQQAGWPEDEEVWTGSCPCFPRGHLVLTDKGLVDISRISPGDKVLTHKGRFRRVIHVGSEISRTVTVKGQGHPGVETTEKHPFYSKTQKKDYRRKSLTYGKTLLSERSEWTPATEMAGRRWATVAHVPVTTQPVFNCGVKGYSFDKSIQRYRVRGEKNGSGVFIGTYISERAAEKARAAAIKQGLIDTRGAGNIDATSDSFAFFLGYWLGDGWVSGDNILLCGSKEDKHLLNEIFQNASLPGKAYIERTSSRIKCGSKALAEWLIDNFDKGAAHKSIPTWMYGMSPAYINAFIDGYFCADGCENTPLKGSPVRQWTTVSKKLAIGLRILLNSQKIGVTVKHLKPNRVCRIEGRVVNERDSYQIIAYPRSRSFKFEGLHGWGLVGSVINNEESKKVYNLSVEEDESYTADGIAVHNCQPWSVAGKKEGAKDDRNLWPDFFRLIEFGKPKTILGEQVAGSKVTGKLWNPKTFERLEPEARREAEGADRDAWFNNVQNDLEGIGYVVGHCVFPACGVGSPQLRQRLYWFARLLDDPESQRREVRDTSDDGATNAPVNSPANTSNRLADRYGQDSRIVADVHENGRNKAGRGCLEAWGNGIKRNGTTGRRRRKKQQDDGGAREGTCPTKNETGGSRTGGAIGELGNAVGKGLEGRGRVFKCPNKRIIGTTGLAGGLEHPKGERRERHQGCGRQERCRAEHAGRANRPGPTNGEWGAVDWIRCRDVDEKTGRNIWRPVEPGSSALAHAIPGRTSRIRAGLEFLGLGAKDLHRVLRESKTILSEARRSRNEQLKVYGNMIVIPQAVEFIRACMEEI